MKISKIRKSTTLNLVAMIFFILSIVVNFLGEPDTITNLEDDIIWATAVIMGIIIPVLSPTER